MISPHDRKVARTWTDVSISGKSRRQNIALLQHVRAEILLDEDHGRVAENGSPNHIIKPRPPGAVLTTVMAEDSHRTIADAIGVGLQVATISGALGTVASLVRRGKDESAVQ